MNENISHLSSPISNGALDRTTPPPTSPIGRITLPDEQVEILPNGIDFHVVNVGSQQICRLALLRDGGMLDFPDLALAMVTNESSMEQTAHHSGEEMADIIDFNGARIVTRLADNYSVTENVVLNSRLSDILPIIGEIVTEATFNPQSVGMVARKKAATAALQAKQVAYVADDRLAHMIFGPNSPAARNPQPADFENITAEACDECYKLMNTGRLHAFLGGSFLAAQIEEVRQFLAALPNGNADLIRPLTYLPQAPGRIFTPMPDAKQSAVSMGIPTITREHPDYIPLRLSIIALGGYFGSRLMSNIREEKGLTYGISSALLGQPGHAHMSIKAQCDAANVDIVIEESIKEIQALITNPPQGGELRRLKQFVWSQLAASVDSPFGILENYITHLLVRTPDDYFQQQLKALELLSPEIIAEMAAKYLRPDKLRISVCGC